MTSAENAPREGFETKQVPGYVPSLVPGGTPTEPGYSNTPGADPATKAGGESGSGGDTGGKGEEKGETEKSGVEKPATRGGATGSTAKAGGSRS
jgi:hypothetical protein